MSLRQLARPTARVLVLVAAVTTTPGAANRLVAQDAGVDPDRFLRHVRYLASDELEGRGNGSPGLDKAAEYIAAEMRAAGLAPAGDAGGYFQGFEIMAGLEIEPGNELRVDGPGGTVRWALGKDYFPVSVDLGEPGVDATQPEALPLVFAGYGISAPAAPYRYDDYAGVDVRGKAVLVFRHEPQEDDPDSRFDGRTLTDHATFMSKAMTARALGARAVVIVEDPAHGVDRTNFAGFLTDPEAESYGIPVLRVRRDGLEGALAGRIDLRAVHKEIDADLVPRSAAIEGVSLTIVERFTKVRRAVRNVIGVLEGRARPADVIVIGAHYDHLGLGGRHSLAPNATGQIHNGADDNASGTAALLEIARAAAADPSGIDRTLVFAAFAGEELGLLGSNHYVTHPPFPLDQTIAMINLDMIGRPNGRILVSGLDTSPSLKEDLDAARAAADVAIEARTFAQGSGVGSSDDTSFLVRKVPSIGFFSGFHSDYHRPGDDWQKVDAKGGAEVAKLALALARRLAGRTDHPEFVAAAAAPHGGTAGSVGGYGPYFGSVPDFAEEGSGVKFAEVREDSPAAKAGLKGGDVLIAFDGTPIKTLYDFTYALRGKRPGDRVEVIALRDGKEIRATVELGSR